MPTHNRSPEFARLGLFREAKNFFEIERRIEQLPTEQDRGAAFEVFVEAYLNTSEIAQATEAWSVGKVPA